MNAIDIIKKYEGCKLTAYVCPAGVLTIGYGHTKNVKAGETISQAKADELLTQDMQEAIQKLDSLKLSLTKPQREALISFVFNLGIEALKKSTLLQKLSAGDVQGAAKEFDKWINAGGKPLQGLIKRRAEEKQLFLS